MIYYHHSERSKIGKNAAAMFWVQAGFVAVTRNNTFRLWHHMNRLIIGGVMKLQGAADRSGDGQAKPDNSVRFGKKLHYGA